uniref:Receptor protein-tyrosine kinase n=1 Tax=Cacopsylla melanoneura TaxID=428564 RepID=A0A8D9BMT9_9HEMI
MRNLLILQKLLLLFGCVFMLMDFALAVVEERVCIGTNGRMSVPSNREHHYRNLRDRYTNCTYVDGNLELTWLQDEHLDLSFLQYIREVTGYVLISHVDVKRIVLPKLQIIRGRTTFKLNVHDEEFSLLILLSKMNNLEMPALRDILAGTAGMFNNYNLCHVKTINWEEILSAAPGVQPVYVYNFEQPERECPPCDKSCTAGCWGEGPDNCQRFSKINCSPQCAQGRCFGPKPRECCHLFCAGGCTGPKQSDCLACKNFYDDGVCTLECPAMQRYNPVTYSWEANPNGKYAYGATCVKNCPEHLLKDNGACVRKCPLTKKAVNGECVACDGPCPKTCEGVAPTELVHSGNIASFKDCTIIEGSLTILDSSFQGYTHIFANNNSFGTHYPKMHPSELEVFSTLKEVTGYINIQGSHPEFTNLSYFRNLEVIGGRQLFDFFASLYIVKTTLKSLDLNCLKKINSGSVAILENKDLCFAQGINWQKIKKSTEHGTLLQNNKPEDDCVKEDLVCDKQCSVEGCWGPGPDQCLSCANYQIGNRCLQDCEPGMYKSSPKMCMPCHEECEATCSGPGPGKCHRCKHVRDGPFCVPFCPAFKYNSTDGECRPCHPNCVNNCTGPDNTIGHNGCGSCERAIIDANATVVRCLAKNEPCPDGYFYEWVGPQEQEQLKTMAGKGVCRMCHPRCRKCTGFGFHEQVCQECSAYKRGEQCEDECPFDYYADETTQECVPCDTECKGCTGPGPTDCLSCENFRIYTMSPNDALSDDPTGSFVCVKNCTEDRPYKVFPQNNSEAYCAARPAEMAYMTEKDQMPVILGAVFMLFFLCMIFLVAVGYRWKQNITQKENAVKMTLVLNSLDDNEPLQPSTVKPNMEKLKIVKEAEMRKGGVLGYGAFGTVYKGVLVPEGENVKIPVAIKVLREGTGMGVNENKEFMEEAYIMASVDHPNLLKLIAVCLTPSLMLVTQLMPLGCLLDYVRKNRDKIGSKPLLNWCTQIARGMTYLEEKRLVHRDLAARNVLVQTPNCVKITDFGLAKLLDINEDEYKADGGKMPIKWLAPECIKERLFNHKSDVWAFGVTIWELLTYGARPYENYQARDVPLLIEKGERLPQPPICTLDLYMKVMLQCWMPRPEARPCFKELAEEFAKMARDPGRYLAIPGDRFMRLPPFTTQDEKEFIRTLALDGFDPSIDSEEYLQPKLPLPCPSQVIDPNVASCHRYPPGMSMEPHAHPGNGRFCIDVRDCTDSSDDLSASKREAQVGNLKLDLPLDDDDYLMPSPQQSQTTTTYMDLISEATSKAQDMAETNNNTCSATSSSKAPVSRTSSSTMPSTLGTQTSVDNPEYHLVATQTLGIPVVVPGIVSNGHTPSMSGGLPGPVHAHTRSSEEESDHEYYNDFDRLQRELQPLRRNETTV